MAQRRGKADGLRSPPASGLLTTREAAALLRVHPKQVYRLFSRGLPHRRVGDEWRYDRDELLAWSGAGPSAGTASASPAPLSPVIASNGDVVVDALLEAATGTSGPVYGSALADRESALAMLRARRILAAGYHGTSFPAVVPEGRMARLHLVRREVGLLARGRTPRLQDVGRGRLATRPPTAGVRRLLDASLREAGMDPRRPAKGALVCRSHRDVAGAVARGDADLGIGTRAWAHVMGLRFLTLATEDYGLLLFAEDLGRAEVVRLCEAAQSEELRARLTPALGYDPQDSGRIYLDRPTTG